MKCLFILTLVMVLVSCQNPTEAGTKKPSTLNSDKIAVTVKDWHQDAMGNLTIHYTVKVLVNVQWQYVKVGLWGSLSNGYVVAYGTTNNPTPLTEYSGTAYTDYTRGSKVLEVGPYNYEFAVNL